MLLWVLTGWLGDDICQILSIVFYAILVFFVSKIFYECDICITLFVGNDKNAIITILSTRSRIQRDEICSKYEQKYNEVSLALKARETYRNEFVFWSFQIAIFCLLFSKQSHNNILTLITFVIVL